MLAQLALRLGAIEALCPFAAGEVGPWPTVAGPRVYDSRIDPIGGHLSAEDPKPTVVLYTEEVEAERGSGVNGYPYHVTVSLVIELGAYLLSTAAEGFVLAAPASDPQLEASLDVLATQVALRLGLATDAQGHPVPAHPAFRMARSRLRSWSSVPYRDGDGGEKFSVRALNLRCELPREMVALASDVVRALPAGSPAHADLTLAIAAVASTLDYVEPGQAPAPVPFAEGMIVAPFDASPDSPVIEVKIPPP